MTLNATLVTPAYVIQASDRRVLSLPDRRVVSDDANKGIVLRCEDGAFAITFAGVGLFTRSRKRHRMDLWMAQQMIKRGAPELPTRDSVTTIASIATRLFRQFGTSPTTAHSFVVAGWRSRGDAAEPAIFFISNTDQTRRASAGVGRFAIREIKWNPSSIFLFVSGMHMAVSEADKRALRASFEKNGASHAAERALVDLIRAAARRPQSQGGIGEDVLSITLSPEGYINSSFWPATVPRSNYAPLFVWHKDGGNFIAGDATLSTPSNYIYRFGDLALVEPAGGTTSAGDRHSPKDAAQFMVQMCGGRFKGPLKEGESQEIVRMSPVSSDSKDRLGKR